MTYIVSLTTIPRRYRGLPKVIYSILKQSCPPKKIYIYVSDKAKLPPHEVGALAHSKIFYKKVPDIGPFTKIFYTLADPEISGDETILVTDDDAIKHVDWAKRLLLHVDRTHITTYAKIIHGGFGYGFVKNIFDHDKIRELFADIPIECRNIDDDFLTLYCVLNEIKIKSIAKFDGINQFRGMPKSSYIGLTTKTGYESRGYLRLVLQKYVNDKHGLYFNLSNVPIACTKFRSERERTISMYEKTFG